MRKGKAWVAPASVTHEPRSRAARVAFARAALILDDMTALLAIGAGVVLAASAGLRAFLPLFAAGAASRALGWDLATEMQWLASNTALTVFGIASLLEVAADKIPVVDHVLDAVHTVVGPIAGAIAGLTVWLNLPPSVAATLAIVVGAPIAGGVHLLAATTRLKSTAVSGGTLNPVASTAEDGVTLTAIAVAILAPLLALAVSVLLIILVVRFAVRRSRRPASPSSGSGPLAGR